MTVEGHVEGPRMESGRQEQCSAALWLPPNPQMEA